MYIYIYILYYMCVCVCVCVCIHIFIGEHRQVEAFLHKVVVLERRSFAAFKQHVTYEHALAGIAGQVAAAASPQPASSPAPFRLAT